MVGVRVKIDDSQLRRRTDELRRSKSEIHAKLWSALLKVHKDTRDRVKASMPVDTGRAKASWGQFTSGDIRSLVSRTGSPNPANPSDAIESFDEGKLETTQGTRVPYVPRLNAGWSRQAPAGFIEMAEAQAQAKMDAEARRIGLTVI